MDTQPLKAESDSTLDGAFHRAFEDVQQLSIRPDNSTLLELYGLYKQGSEGDVSGDKPGFFDFVGVAKYEAWEKWQGTHPDTAKQRYIELVDQLKAA